MRIGFKVLIMVTAISLLAEAILLAVYVRLNGLPPQALGPLVAASAGIVVIAVTIGFAVTRRITAPLCQLTEAAEQFAKGNLGYHVDVTPSDDPSDELGMLGRAFNMMSDELKRAKAREHRYQEDLERSVREKTAELRQKVDELEEFTKLSVGRELRMVELKREVAELKERPGTAIKGKGRQREPEAALPRKAG